MSALIFLAGIALFIGGFTQIPYLLIINSSARATLPFSITRLSPLSIATLILLIILKYPLRLLSLVPRLEPTSTGYRLPHLTLSTTVRRTASESAAYAAAVPLDEKQAMLLGALINPTVSMLLSSRLNPIMPFGAVNATNRFEFLKPDVLSDALDDECAVEASFGGPNSPGRRVKRGIEFDIIITVTHPTHGVIFRQVATILSMLPKSAKPEWVPTEAKADEAWTPQTSDVVKLAFSAPTKWAAVCKDYNPIHMSSVLARAFGFPGKIAHGNQVLACVMAKFENPQKGPFAIDVAYKRPMTLPLDMDVEFAAFGATEKLRTVSKGKEYMTASRMPL